MARPFAVSLGDVAAAGVRLRPTDAVTIVRALVLQIANRTLPGVPSAHVIRLLPSGAVTVGGPVVATGDAVPRAAQLLADLLPGARRAGAEQTPLVKLIDRALHDPTAFGSLEDFAAALAPFAAHDPTSAIVDVTARWAGASTSPGSEASTTADEPAGDSTGLQRRASRTSGVPAATPGCRSTRSRGRAAFPCRCCGNSNGVTCGTGRAACTAAHSWHDMPAPPG